MTCKLMNKKDVEEGRCVWCGEKKVEMHHDYWDGTSYCPCGCEGEKEEKRLKEEIKKVEEHLKELNFKLREHRKTGVYYKELTGLLVKIDKLENQIENLNENKFDVSREIYNMVVTEMHPIEITPYGRESI